jgi:hypothetical protein
LATEGLCETAGFVQIARFQAIFTPKKPVSPPKAGDLRK